MNAVYGIAPAPREPRIDRLPAVPETAGMDQATVTDLEALALHAARQVGAERIVEQVEVTSGATGFDRPTYQFSFLVESGPDRPMPSLFRIRLTQKLRDALSARGDAHYPVLRILDRTDWNRRNGA